MVICIFETQGYVPDVFSFGNELYPHWRYREYPALPPHPNRIVTKDYSKTYQKNIEEKCTCGLRNLRPTNRVIGGDATEAHEFPFQVAILYKNTRVSVCGATLINSHFVLTAGHCLYDVAKGVNAFGVLKINSLQLLLHAHNLNRYQDIDRDSETVPTKPAAEIKKIDSEDGAIRVNPTEFIPHPGWTQILQINQSRIVDDDIALIRLNEPIDLTNPDGPWTVCLPDSDEFIDYANKEAIILGWGTISPHSNINLANKLQKLRVPLLHEKLCPKTVRGGQVFAHFVCMGAIGRSKDAAEGDSGGPLLFDNNMSAMEQLTQIGVASFTDPALGLTAYARVAEYLPWIYHEIGKAEEKGIEIKWCKSIS